MILVTGANGFVGRNLCKKILSEGRPLRAASRSGTDFSGAENVVFDIEAPGDLTHFMRGVDIIIHLAARAHQLHEKASDPLDAFRKVNRDAALQLMSAAANNGVSRFVYVSSVGVNGNETAPGRPFCDSDQPNPHDAYAISKHEAELALADLSAKRGIELVIVRPPLVYGPGAPGNFARLLKLINTGLPLPLGGIDNSRSYIYVQNLADALLACASHAQAASRTYLVSDGEDISTPGLIKIMAALMDRPARLVTLPPRLVRSLLLVVGKAGLFDKLAGSLQIDSSRICTELGWRPPFDLTSGLRATLIARPAA